MIFSLGAMRIQRPKQFVATYVGRHSAYCWAMFWDAEHPDTLYSMSFLVAILEAERQYAGAEKLEREGWRLRAIGQAARATFCHVRTAWP